MSNSNSNNDKNTTITITKHHLKYRALSRLHNRINNSRKYVVRNPKVVMVATHHLTKTPVQELHSSKKILETLRISIRYRHVLAEVSLSIFQRINQLTYYIGAYGEVRKCLHKETKALRAVKIINKKRLAEEEKLKLLNEIDILK